VTDKPEQAAPPEHTGGEPDTTTQPVSGSAAAPAPGSNGEYAPDANGHAEDVAPRLPPPWERVPSPPPEATPDAGNGPATGYDAGAGYDAHGYDAGAGYDGAEAAPAAAWGGADRGGAAVDPGVEHGSVPGTPIGRGVSDLGDARTVGVDPRVGLGGLGGGFGSGTPAAAPSSGPASSTPGGFPAAWPRNRRPRQANLQLKRLDPWSVLKIALVLSVVLYLVWMVAVGVLYGALDGIGVWERLNGQYSDLVAEHAGDRLISAGRIFGFAAVVGAVNSLLVAVAFSVSAFIYNVSADMVGGIEVTLSERD
jgi:hypothetical protein